MIAASSPAVDTKHFLSANWHSFWHNTTSKPNAQNADVLWNEERVAGSGTVVGKNRCLRGVLIRHYSPFFVVYRCVNQAPVPNCGLTNILNYLVSHF